MDIANIEESKIADDRPSYNFIDRIPDIYDQIFGFLDHKSLLNALLVCTSWNKFIGQSSDLMKKTKVYLPTAVITLEHLKIIQGWKRKIIHLKVNYLISEYQKRLIV